MWEELGEAFSSVESIVIAKMDATANEHEHVDVSGFPSIQFFAANSKTPVDYDGSRTLDGFVAFLKNHATRNVEAVEAIDPSYPCFLFYVPGTCSPAAHRRLGPAVAGGQQP